MNKLLFTPGPLTTSITVKEAMLHDYGSRDDLFIGVVKEIRETLLQMAFVSNRLYDRHGMGPIFRGLSGGARSRLLT